MIVLPQSLADYYERFLRSVFHPSSVAEGIDAWTNPDELELQCRWFAGDFGRQFRGTDGEAIEIVQFGEWNRGAGPDFSNVVVQVNGESRRGDLELDTQDRDWEHHGHAENPAYGDVQLHLFVVSSGRGRYFTRDHAHREVPQVRLELSVIDPRRWGQGEAISRIGRCSTPLAGMSVADVESLLAAAAQYRLKRKAQRFHRIADAHGRDEALFQLSAEALGYRHNRLPATLLAQQLPLKLLRREKEAGEALLFGAAGFLDRPTYEDAALEARPYLRNLWETWWKRREPFGEGSRGKWRFSGARPANHPHRRLGALSALVARWRDYTRLVFDAPWSKQSVTNFFASLEHHYWSNHYTLRSTALPKPMKLVGESRVTEILGNILYPIAVEEDHKSWEDYEELPARLGNEKTERAMIRLFGKRPDAEKFLRRVYQQQGLLQIYDDYCLADESDCRDCPFPEQLAKWNLP
ncbi:MAG: DUF2851 family protein [Verrucomicrobiota bacterium]